jgi:hypothetical protein
MSVQEYDEKIASPQVNSADVVEDGASTLVETVDVYDGEESGVDPVYQGKARVLNNAFQEMGMGKYQVRRRSRISC